MREVKRKGLGGEEMFWSSRRRGEAALTYKEGGGELDGLAR
jgi:hypothetical protein